MNTFVFGKPMENVRKHRNIKLVARKRRSNYLVSKSNFDTTKFSTEMLLAIEMKKTEMFMNKPVYLRVQIQELIQILLYDFWYDYENQNMVKKQSCVIIDTDNFIVYIKTDDSYKEISKDVETRFDALNYELDRALPKGKYKKAIRSMKDK